MKGGFALFCAMALTLSASAEGTIDGKWEARFTDPRGAPVLIEFAFKANGQDVIGTMTAQSGSQRSEPIPIQNGKIRGDTLTFTTVYTLPLLKQRFITGRQIADWITHFGVQNNTITGTIRNDTITFTQHDWTGRHPEFEAKKRN